MLGSAVVSAATNAGLEVTPLTRQDLDITDADAVDAAIESIRPKTIVNCAAWTDVAGAEHHEPEAMKVNADGPANLAAAACRHHAALVHVSTDYVFNGTKELPYVEADRPAPINAYGRTKRAGELAILPEATVVRTSWLFGPGGENFVEKMLRRAAEKLQVVDDQVGSPTYTLDLAEAIVQLAASKRRGIHHLAASGQCSWFEFAKAIFDISALEVDLAPIDSRASAVRRPALSALASTRNSSLRHWTLGLDDYLQSR